MFILQYAVVAAVAYLVSWFIDFRIRRRRLYQLAEKLPGPPQTLPLVGSLHRFIGDTEDITKTIQDLGNMAIQEGVLKFWLGSKLYCMIADPIDIEYILKSHLDKDDTFRFIRELLGDGIIFAPASAWRRRRKIAAIGFSTRNLQLFQQVFSKKSELLTKRLERLVGAGSCDLWPEVNYYTLESISETMFGRTHKRRSEDHLHLLKCIAVVLSSMTKRFFHPWLQPDWLYKLVPSYNSYKSSSDFLYSYVDDCINWTRLQLKTEETAKTEADQDRANANEEWTSFLRLLIKQSNRSQDYTDLELREEVMSLGVAGTDTSAVGTCFTLFLLARHQDVQEKVYQELVDVFGTSERPLTMEDLPKLCYLDRVIKESLRLYPPGPIMSRQSDKDITLPSGKILPAGCGIPICIWSMHRNPKYWGEDAEQFRPERFSPENYTQTHPCVYMPFSVGPRNCLGAQYGLISMKTSLSSVLRKYRLRAADEAPIRVKFEILLKSMDGFKVLVDKRKSL